MGLLEAIGDAGSDNVEVFGGKFEGGYHIQQDPAEFAGLIEALRGRSIASYLQVGTAAGGAERFLCETLGIRDMTIIDLGEHPKFHVWIETNKPALEGQGVKVTQHIGDSHDEAAEDFLAHHGKKFDLIGIDGDHTPAGVRMDWKLIEPCLKPGALVWFHDLASHHLSASQRGALEVWDVVSKRHRVLYETFDKFGIGLLEIA